MMGNAAFDKVGKLETVQEDSRGLASYDLLLDGLLPLSESLDLRARERVVAACLL
jgi:hypothetical protein